jgi:hypothetical protein
MPVLHLRSVVQITASVQNNPQIASLTSDEFRVTQLLVDFKSCAAPIDTVVQISGES